MNIAGRILLFTGFLVLLNPLYGQSESQGDVALHRYYSDLDLALAETRLSDIPFQQDTVEIARNDTLIELAIQHTFAQLDFFHLAAAIYQNNPSAFKDKDPTKLRSDAVIKMPSVGDLYLSLIHI